MHYKSFCSRVGKNLREYAICLNSASAIVHPNLQKVLNREIKRISKLFFDIALYLLYASVEEEHGLARHAMAVYERATKAVLPQEQFEVDYLRFFPTMSTFLLSSDV